MCLCQMRKEEPKKSNVLGIIAGIALAAAAVAAVCYFMKRVLCKNTSPIRIDDDFDDCNLDDICDCEDDEEQDEKEPADSTTEECGTSSDSEKE